LAADADAIAQLVLPPTIAWFGDAEGVLLLLDQTRLPHEQVVLEITDAASAASALRSLAVRGAPAVGIAAAYGLYLGVRAQRPLPGALVDTAREIAAMLLATRPTGVNLAWALDRCLLRLRSEPSLAALFAEAQAIHLEDETCCRRIGTHGADLIRDGMTVLTHGNTGRLATTGDGTALAILYEAARRGRRFSVLATETRPLFEGSRLTALELRAAGLPVELIADAAAAGLIARGAVHCAVVGADRIAKNGDVANKVGTYPIALACATHQIPFVVAAPWSTFDHDLEHGSQIPIEERPEDEVLHCAKASMAPPGVHARNPAYDITPARLVTAIVTDRGVLRAPFEAAIKTLR
jgi:methylthioribose-1-phosphate isomerase